MLLSAFAVLHDPASRTYHNRCRARGKTHSVATLLLDRGHTLHVVQDFLGHTAPRTTRRYDQRIPRPLPRPTTSAPRWRCHCRLAHRPLWAPPPGRPSRPERSHAGMTQTARPGCCEQTPFPEIVHGCPLRPSLLPGSRQRLSLRSWAGSLSAA
ncbi:site-specific integrase [Actinomadura sp. KC06]|nr:site-specific integrase [Actinomadura sp. KC06]